MTPPKLVANDWDALVTGLSDGAVIRDSARFPSFCTDPMQPSETAFTAATLAVVQPQSTREIQHIVRWARARNIALVPQGGHTNRTSGAVPEADRPSLIISMNRYNRIDPINQARDCVTVDAGVTLAQLQQAAAQHQRLVGVDIGARDSAQIGGMLATNAGGMQSVRYGSMRAQLLGLEVVTGTGEILSHMQGLYKNNTGYDWMQLFVGAEGTLGLISRAIIRLYPAPQHQRTVLLCTQQAVDCISILRSAQEQFDTALQRIEIICAAAWEGMCNMPGAPASAVSPTPPYLMLMDVSEPDEQRVMDWLEPLYNQQWITDAVIPQSLGQQQDLWALRDRGAYLNTVYGPLVSNDIALRPETIPDFLEQCAMALNDYMPGLIPLPFGHLGDGNLHYNIAFPNHSTAIEVDRHKEPIRNLVADLTVQMGGTFSAEHGIGTRKLSAMARYKDVHTLQVMRNIKTLFDPDCICNPGKLLPPSEG